MGISVGVDDCVGAGEGVCEGVKVSVGGTECGGDFLGICVMVTV